MKKKVIIGIFVILIIVLIVFFVQMWRPAYLKVENRSSQAVPQHGMSTLTENQYCITEDGDSYLIDYEQL